MAIHPYPAHFTHHWQLADGTNVISRPIRPEDAERETAFIARLSEQAKYFRFMSVLHKLTPEMLVRFTQIDYDREMALIALISDNDAEKIIAVARYITNPDGVSCEFAIVVADEWIKKGIGSQLMHQLMDVAKSQGLRSMEGEVLSDNRPMLDMVRALGFSVVSSRYDPGVMLVSRAL